MRSRRRLLGKSRLYLILDKDTLGCPLTGTTRKLATSGVDIIQLRDKSSSLEAFLKEAVLLNKVLKNTDTLFIVNDNPDIAKASGSDGLHIGQSDLSIQKARALLGKDMIIGVSCHNLKQALKAQEEGADYIGIGPIFKTKTKPGLEPIGLKSLKGLAERIKIPVFAIGNINRANLRKITLSGIKRIAVCRALLRAKDPVRAAEYFLTSLEKE